MDDSKIVELYLSRDEAAISETALKYGSRLRSIANRILGDISASEECENDTYLKAWGLIPPHEPRSYLFSFLGKITRHLAIDECRKRDSEKRSAVFCELTQEMRECLPSENDDAESLLEASELRCAVNAFLERQSDERQNIFVRRYWYFDSIPEISRRYGFSRSKVKMTLCRMREELRVWLGKEGYTV